ncbi:tetratricopeptide repeat protein [Sphingosinicella sp. LHD-64]|uniref:tetratricopeptide repeat protein n=1 Tax=Sphingosinicella sp. LHD-64 TaxID=3072139 RepID=UPI00280D41D8|nr:tetratricopeptide repeat protein [Sphingosinicella sp. LHD-64]MDQ8755670.1 tetratricopeptide repeat protein [Sphingosinicella sp. LHD-64]
MKGFAVLAAALAMVPAAASAQAVEEGFPRGSLAVAAIDRGDWNRAEALLRTSQLEADDPARLINLGAVYMQTGRTSEALTAWRAALASNRHSQVETIGGRWVSTRDLAREALARYETAQVRN